MSIRIVWVGYFNSSPWRTDESRFADALERLGAEIVRLDPPWVGLESELDSSSLVIFSKCQKFPLARLVRLTARPHRPPVVQVLFDLMDYEERLIRGLPWPVRSRTQWWLSMARHFDMVFLKERGRFDQYTQLGVRCTYLDQAAESAAPACDLSQYEERYDIAFIGSWTKSRSRRFHELSEGSSGVVYGPGWKRVRSRRQLLEVRPPVHDVQFVAAVRSAKVIWAENSRHDIDGYWSDRVYQVLASGGVFLTRYTPGLEDVFENGRHLVWYHTFDEAKQLVGQLLAEPQWRERLRTEGRSLVETRHTYDQRASDLLNLTAEVRRGM